MKKSVVSMLSLAVAVGLLTACGGSGQNVTKSSAAKSSAVKSESVPASQVSQIVTGSQSSSSTVPFSSSISSAISTIPTAPSTITFFASIMAVACCL